MCFFFPENVYFTPIGSVNAVKPEPVSPYQSTFYKLFPWKRPRHLERVLKENGSECQDQSSLDEFPEDLFSRKEKVRFYGVPHFFIFALFS